MKRLPLLIVHQYEKEFFVGCCDPRILVMMADQSIDDGHTQDAQRPLEKKRLLDIAEYVAPPEKGMLPVSITIGTNKRDTLTVEKEQVNGETFYYLLFPENEQELKQFNNCIDIIDGQHRLFSFSPKYRSQELKDDMVYELSFALLVTPNLHVRQKLFTITNEKQRAVNSNLLLFLKEQLGMLSAVEKEYYQVVRSLNTENKSPLQGRIIMSAERISKGYKAKELVRILEKSKLARFRLNNQECDQETQVTAISTYLDAWEKFYNLSYAHPGKETMTKISGLRYVLILLPAFLEYAVSTRQSFTTEFVMKLIQDLEDYKQLTPDQTLFDNSLEFRGEGATVKMALDDRTGLKTYLASKDTEGFNPFA